MERIQSINPDRIAWCCAEHGISPRQLASDMGIAAASMEHVMAGEDGLTYNQLRKIADHFGRGVLFFLEPGQINDAQVHTPQFRTLANQKPELSRTLKTLIERVEKQRGIYLSLLEELDETDRDGFSPPDLPRHNPREAAAIARRWLGLNDKNNFDTYRTALEAKGILVFRSNGYSGKWQIAKDSPILGFALYDPACPVIVIKKQPYDTQQSFTLMHELGHILLQQASSIDDDDDMHSHQSHEQTANAFAGHLLAPDHFLAQIHDENRPEAVSLYDEWLAPQRNAWGISTEVILRRLMDSGRLSQIHYTAYREWRALSARPENDGGTRMYRHREPKHIFGDRFVSTVLDALNSRHITLSKASSYLDSLKINDLHELERHYAGL